MADQDGQTSTFFGDQLSYSDLIPMDVEPLAMPPDVMACQRLSERNIAVLRAVAVLEDQHAESEDRAGLEGDIGRLERKVDLLIELVRSVLSIQAPPPQERQVTMSSHGVVWLSDDAPGEAGDTMVMSLFVHHATPQAIQWPFEIAFVEPCETGVRCGGRFLSMPDEQTRQLEKLIFRRHRRQVAVTRKQAAQRLEGAPAEDASESREH